MDLAAHAPQPLSAHPACPRVLRLRHSLLGRALRGEIATGASGDTWLLTKTTPESSRSFGAGCLGSRGVPELEGPHGVQPLIGGSLDFELSVLPWIATPTFLQIGLSNTSLLGAGSAAFSLPLPYDATLVGAHVHAQGFLVDRNAPGERIFTNGVDCTIGW